FRSEGGRALTGGLSAEITECFKHFVESNGTTHELRFGVLNLLEGWQMPPHKMWAFTAPFSDLGEYLCECRQNAVTDLDTEALPTQSPQCQMKFSDVIPECPATIPADRGRQTRSRYIVRGRGRFE